MAAPPKRNSLYLKNRSTQCDHLSKKVRSLRKSAGYTQEEVAKKVNITRAAIVQIEKGSRMPSILVCRKLAETFNISLNELTEASSLPKSDEKPSAYYWEGFNNAVFIITDLIVKNKTFREKFFFGFPLDWVSEIERDLIKELKNKIEIFKERYS